MKYGVLYAYWEQNWTTDYVECLKRTKAAGFDIMEIGASHLLEMSDAYLAELKTRAEEMGVLISSNIGPPKDKDVASSDSSVRKEGIKYLSNILRQMDKVGSKTLVGVTYTYWPNDFSDLDKAGLWARGVASVKEFGKVAQDLNIDVCLEVVNRYETITLNTAEEGIRFCDEVNNPNVKLLLDTFHMNIEEDNIADAIRETGSKYLGHLHVGESNRKLPGKGSLPWRDIGKALNDIGFTGGVVMEPFVTHEGQIAEDIKVWRDLTNGATREEMDRMLADSLVFLKHEFNVDRAR
jgi:D-psicose/D-tagatose/L-ribulose 3-epimerase